MPALTDLLLFAFALCAVQPTALAQKTRHKDCVTEGVHVISVRGHGIETPPYGLSTSTINNITTFIPGSNAVAVKYPSDNTDDFQAATVGAKHAKKYIREYALRCPDTKIVLQGYSQGAIALMTALCGQESPNEAAVTPLNSKYANNIIAVVTFGDETRVSAAPYNAGTCTNNGPFARTSFDCGAYTDRIRSWCDSVDPDCCDGGNNINSHFAYPGLYNGAVVDFIEQQLGE